MMTTGTLYSILLACLAFGVLTVFLILRKRTEIAVLQERLHALEKDKENISRHLSEKESLTQQLNAEITHLKTRLAQNDARHEADLKAAAEKEALLEQAEQKLVNTFKALSSEALQHNNKSFLDLAKTTIERFQEGTKGNLEKHQQAIDNIINPIHKSLEKFDQKVNNLEKAREGAYAGLSEQIKNLLTVQVKLEGETANLVKALRVPHVRGQWGELQLRRTVEMAGMLNHVDFVEQDSVTTEDGRQRPDMVVRLPNGRNVVVDAKAPLSAYLDALDQHNADDQIRKLKDHARQIRDHLLKLGAKNYWKQFEPTPEFVVLFLPGEPFFSAALEQDPTLIDFGVDNRVILATPTTLIALLKAVAYGWRQESIAQEAKTISELGSNLYERMAVLATHFVDIRKGLERSVVSYNKAVSSMETRVLPTARKFKELHVTTDRDVPQLSAIENALTEPVAEEMLASN